MRRRLQRRATFGVGLASLAVGAAFWALGEVDLGVRLTAERDHVVIAEVMPGGLADRVGIAEGSTVVGLNGAEPPVRGGFPTGTSTAEGQFEGFTGDVPEHPLPERQISFLLTGEARVGEDGLPTVIDARALRRSSLVRDLRGAGWDLLVAAGMLAAALAWHRRASALAAVLAPSAALAVSIPFLVLPAHLSGTPLGLAAAAILPAAVTLTLGNEICRWIADRRLDDALARVSIALVAVAFFAGLAMLGGWMVVGWAKAIAATSLAAAVMVPIAGGLLRPRSAARSLAQRLLVRIDLALIGLAVGISLPVTLMTHPPAWSIAVAILGALALRRFAMLPAAWVAERAELQRDALADATEAERLRLAAELHDDVLQNLWLLIRRLHLNRDPQSAEAARDIGARLRGISGQLHLPILDDLGVGPALEWLVESTGRMGVEGVRLEAEDGDRLPPAVELAMFRIAQEALANAIHHGRPPIVVRYAPGARTALLLITDAGPGIDAMRPSGRGANHHGMTTMQLRADQIGARLMVRSLPVRGSEVRVSWPRP